MANRKVVCRILLLLTVLVGCRDKYMIRVPTPLQGYLVVEGFINLGTGPTIIQLTRTTGLDSAHIVYETGAQVIVQSQSGAGYSLAEMSPGKYIIAQVLNSINESYQVLITTADGKKYASDLEPLKVTPEIDSVQWQTTGSFVSVSVSSHDPQNKTTYYQWQFEETWQYTSLYESLYEYVDDSLIFRSPADKIHTCWRSDTSNTINIASSEKLKQDVISDFPLTEVPIFSSDKLLIEYSILVKQYALTKDWYEWIQKLQKNTQAIGSIFDAQPSQNGGNLHCITDPGEIVVGFVGCTTETVKRIFIRRSDIPGITNQPYYVTCSLDTLPNSPSVLQNAFTYPGRLPVNYIFDRGVVIGVSATDADCADCRAQGGFTTKPDFWQ